MSRRGKNIVICCDGTGQSIPAAERSEAGVGMNPGRSNVLRLFHLLVKDSPHQVCWYDAGIGTIPLLEREQRTMRLMRNIRDEWLGLGLMENVSEAYLHLMEQYEPGDRIFLIGFSRGAFTVRALAGMIRCVGLLRRENRNLLSNARDVFENMERRLRPGGRHRQGGLVLDADTKEALAAEFRRFSRHDPVRVSFLGVWDTVKAYGYFVPRGFPFIRNNELVDVVRHAVAIDERRSPFQVTGWCDRTVRTLDLQQDIEEVWFTGDHSNIGGGHRDADLLAKTAFDWMLGEATAFDLLVDLDRYTDATGWDRGAIPAADARPNDLSRKATFRIADILPRRELNNTYFPPQRTWRAFGSTGARRPLNHKFPDDIWAKAQHGGSFPQIVRVHSSVKERCGTPESLPRGFQDLLDAAASAANEAKRTSTPPRLSIEWVETRKPLDSNDVLLRGPGEADWTRTSTPAVDSSTGV
jgi:uncharacterized protein (DUF2235 family)